MLLAIYLLSLSIHNDLLYNVNTHSDAYFTWNVLINHLTSRSESMVHYQSLYLTKLAFKWAPMSFKSENTNSIWKYESHLWKYPSHLSENGEISINQVDLEWKCQTPTGIWKYQIFSERDFFFVKYSIHPDFDDQTNLYDLHLNFVSLKLLRVYSDQRRAFFFCCGNSAAVISKPHTFKWDPLADDVFPSAHFTLPPKRRPPTGPI